MTYLRRFIAWAFYCGLLAAVGASAFLFIRYRPRCTIEEPYISVLHLSADGSRLVTCRQRTKAGQGPVKVWDTHHGQVVREMLGAVELDLRWERSPDGRHIAVRLPDGMLQLMDWRTGAEWRFGEQKDVHYFYLSPQGRWLFVSGAAPRGGVIVDVTTRQVGCRFGDEDVSFSPDDRWAFARQGGNGQVDVWDLSAAKKISTIPSETGMVVSPDGGSLVTWLLDEKTDRALAQQLKMRIPDRGLEIWDLPTGRKRCRLDFLRVGRGHAEFSPNGRFLALWIENDDQSQLKLLDAADGKTRWEAATPGVGGGEFSPDGTSYLCWTGDKLQTFTMVDVATGRKLWERQDAGPSITRFAGAQGNLIFQERGDKPLVLLDVRTGATNPNAPADFYMSNSLPLPTPDGRHLVMSGRQTPKRTPYFWDGWLEKLWPQWFGGAVNVTLVLETATGRELFRIRNYGNLAQVLSDDGSTLLTLDEIEGVYTSGTIRIWDVHPHRAWTWAISSVVATLLVYYCLARWVRSLRNRQKKSAPANESRS